jgi:hypothetical protein
MNEETTKKLTFEAEKATKEINKRIETLKAMLDLIEKVEKLNALLKEQGENRK